MARRSSPVHRIKSWGRLRIERRVAHSEARAREADIEGEFASYTWQAPLGQPTPRLVRGDSRRGGPGDPGRAHHPRRA